MIKFPPLGKRSFGVNRAHGYGSTFNSYLSDWNSSSIYIAQIESLSGLKNIDSILKNPDLDGVMIGPYDMSGSLGVPGQISHQKMIDAEKEIIGACKSANKSCGTQIAEFSPENIEIALEKGYTFIIASSDLFVLNSWAERAGQLMNSYRS